MCGIAGIVDFDRNQNNNLECLHQMVALLNHRGPDAAGIYHKGPAGLAHARLSIIDLEGGDQPIHNEDRTLWVVFNGEIFNYPELRKKLVARGHKFYTQTDTEILVHLYEDKGTEMFADLNGQFAFSIWDQKRNILVLGRDRMGIRPLFIYRHNSRLVFGSEIKALFADHTIPRVLDQQSLSDIFTCWSSLAEKTAFENIYQIMPGHFAVFSKKGLHVQPYWKLSENAAIDNGELNERPFIEWLEEFNDLILDATRIRLRADVPVGAYLSGGVDSTFTSAMVKKNFNNFLCTFSVRFEDKRFDETEYQNRAIDSLKTDHRSIQCAEGDIGQLFPNIIWHTEIPILRTAPAPLWQLSKLVRDNQFKVVLTGEGADEIFAGYNIFKEDKVRRFWARHPESKMRPELIRKLYPYIFQQNDGKNSAFLKGFFKKYLMETDSPVYSHMLRWQNTAYLKNFFSVDLRNKTEDFSQFVERFASTLPPDFMKWHPLSRAQYTEINVFLANYLLSSQGDRMAMANSVEGRYPFLDHRVVEFAFRVPPKYRLNGLKEKYILKQSAKNLVPIDLIERPKQPYRAPISHSFLSDPQPDYVNELLSQSNLIQKGYFDPKRVARLMTKCRNQDGKLLSERENMALVGILSTQLLDDMFIKNFPRSKRVSLKNVKYYG